MMTEGPELIVNGKRLDKRNIDEMRNVKIVPGVLSSADGSAYIEWGGNKIICGVYGPRECIPKHGANPYRALIKCRYSMSPFSSLEEHSRSGPSRRSNELSKVIKEAFENLIIAEAFPRTQIDIFIEILQAEGGTRVASITAAAVALANAGIPMKDMASAVAVGKIGGKLVLDLSKDEDNFGQSDLPVALSARNKDILLLQMDGLLTLDELKTAFDLAEKGCDDLNKMQSEALRKMYDTKHDQKKLLLG